MDENVKEILGKQLQLLSDQSKNETLSPEELARLSHAMVAVASVLVGPLALRFDENYIVGGPKSQVTQSRNSVTDKWF